MGNLKDKPIKLSDETAESVSGGTGLYGVEYVYAINPNLCIRCGSCQYQCITTAIVKEDGKYFILPDYCYGCGACKQVCNKEGAIYMTKA